MFRIGTIAGSDVLVSYTWFLIAGLIAVLMAPRVDQIEPGLGFYKYLVGFMFAVALYGAVLLHEASHAFMARHYGYPVKSITLHFLGGSTAVEGEARKPSQEFWIAFVGPITSIAVGVAALALWFVVPDGVLLLVIEGLAGANLIIGVSNLVPGLPLDGGRVLKAAVWAVTGRSHTGTVVAAWAGRVVAGLLAAWALVLVATGFITRDPTGPLLVAVIALFLWSGASAALQSAQVHRQLGQVVARDLARRAVTVPSDLPLSEAMRHAQQAEAGSIVTLTAGGVPDGLVDERAAAAVPADRRPWMPVADVARRLRSGLTLPVTITGEELVAAIRTTPASEYLLVEADGAIHGVLVTEDVVRAVRAR